jgi:hypothetical protein
MPAQVRETRAQALFTSNTPIATAFERGQKPVLPKDHAVRPPIGGLLVIAQRGRELLAM